MTRRLLKGFMARYQSDPEVTKFPLLSTINRAVERAGVLFSRSPDGNPGGRGHGPSAHAVEQLHASYRDAMIAVLVGILGPDMLFTVLGGGSDLEDLDAGQGEVDAAVLMAAAYLGRLDHMAQLLNRGTSSGCDPGDKWVYPPLMAAALAGNMDVVRFLQERGVDLDTRTVGNGYSALHFVALAGQEDLINFLLGHGLDPDVRDNDGDTPLQIAAACGDAQVVQRLLSSGGVNVNRRDHWDCAPLAWAAARGYYEVAVELLNCGKVDINGIYYLGQQRGTVTEIAARAGHERTFYLLFSYFPNPSISLFGAALSGNRTSIVKTIVEANPDIVEQYENHTQSSALLEPARNANNELLSYMLSQDYGSINQDNGSGYTALHYAVMSGSTSTVKLLIDHKATDININIDPDSVSTPIHCAIASRGLTLEILHLMLDNPGLQRNAVNTHGQTVFLNAVSSGAIHIVKALLSRADIDIHAVDDEGNTALMTAARWGHLEVFNILLQVPGTRFEQRDSRGRSALFLAMMHGQLHIVRRFLERDMGITVECLQNCLLDDFGPGTNLIGRNQAGDLQESQLEGDLDKLRKIKQALELVVAHVQMLRISATEASS